MIKKIIISSILSTLAILSLKNVENKEIENINNNLKTNDISLGQDYEDPTSASMGVYVNTSLWEVRWNNNYPDIETTWNNEVYGKTDIHIGEAFYKTKINGMYWTSMIFAIKAKPQNTWRQVKKSSGAFWWYKEWDEDIEQYGCLKSINVKSQLNESDASIIDSYPKFVANASSYTISDGVSAGTSGFERSISSGVSYTKNAIEITNNTNSSAKLVGIKISRNDNFITADAKKEMAQEKWYYFRFDCYTREKYLHQVVDIELTYQQLDDELDNNPNVWRTSINNWRLTFA